MATASSFDVVSDFDQQELVNAVDQARREINNRYDLKDSTTTLDLTADTLTINTDSEFSLDAVVTLLQTKVAKRNLSLKIFDFGKVETASGNRVRQVITLQRGLSTELAKDLSKQIRDQFKKVQVSIQGDALRVSAKSKDDLQTVIQYLKQQDVPAPLQFTNYR
ncbi:YajQ family cyclic di-GMP-binding protein [Synechococcus elongatus]|uniref:Nucleotide-binding protein DOP62_11965 n=1 Tax=Synechococcus elongatus PCC 11801 TaxID=2219813 RepID=A0AAN1QPT1_SYNEL|nr:YajQ family cyclic di-GMP-binding protein [Synechococcus elongatus]AZB73330.1 YajQ family cyclic di-GMP-binding protein [Synechococcus elongatus PCC 11801]